MKRDRNTLKTSNDRGWALVTDTPIPAGDTLGADMHRGPPLARLRLEKRRGKPVTVATVEGLTDAELRPLAKELKTLCGTGGTVKGSAIELQGDHRPTLRETLTRRGMRVKG